MAKGLRKAISELRKCPAGWGHLLKYDTRKDAVILSDDIANSSSSPSWAKLEPGEIDLGFHTEDDLPSIRALEDLLGRYGL